MERIIEIKDCSFCFLGERETTAIGHLATGEAVAFGVCARCKKALDLVLATGDPLQVSRVLDGLHKGPRD
jgi:hypothetical protein